MKGGVDEFLYDLREVACAQEGGIQHVAEQAKLGRESIYKLLSKRGNPRIKTIDSILDAVGLRISVSKNQKAQGSTRASKIRSKPREEICI